MATLSLTILKSKQLSDGRHKIRIAIHHKHETRYLVTRFTVSGKQFRNGSVVGRPDAPEMNRKLRGMMDSLQDRIDGMRHIDSYSCAQVRDMLCGNALSEEQTFYSSCMEFVKELKSDGRDSYAASIERVGRYFSNFSGGDVFLEDITPELVSNFAKFIRKRGVTEATVNTMMSQMKAVINREIRSQNVRYDVHPFVSTRISSSPVRKLDISVHNFNKIRNSNPDKRRTVMARDLFCLSFYLGGMNLIDIMQADFRNPVLEYTRSKTKGRGVQDSVVSFTIHRRAREIIDRWMDRRTGKLDFGYKLAYHPFCQYVSGSISLLAKELNISERVTFYSARKSFAQYASELGISDGIIDYCLGHSDKCRGIIRYYTKVRKRQADAAIGKVVDYVEDPEKYESYLMMRSEAMMSV